MEINLHLGATELVFIGLFLVLAIALCYLYLRQPSAAGGPTPSIPWRKLAPYLAFAGLGVLFVVLRPAVHNLLLAAYGGASAPGALNADGAEIAADQVAGGYVQLGNATSKIVMMLAVFTLFSFWPWLIQQLTHPALTAWKKERFKTDFEALTVAEKFDYDKGAKLAISILAAGCIIGACLIQ